MLPTLLVKWEVFMIFIVSPYVCFFHSAVVLSGLFNCHFLVLPSTFFCAVPDVGGKFSLFVFNGIFDLSETFASGFSEVVEAWVQTLMDCEELSGFSVCAFLLVCYLMMTRIAQSSMACILLQLLSSDQWTCLTFLVVSPIIWPSPLLVCSL